jgi:16S rRNA (cytosine1402-N4)-methyltransferase
MAPVQQEDRVSDRGHGGKVKRIRNLKMHTPVLLRESVEQLNPSSNQNFIDCTLGEAGHTKAILEKNGPKGKVLGIDQDAEQIKKIPKQERLILANDNFSNLKEIARKKKFGPVSGILLDLGIASSHFEESGRGFSFLKKESLDMRLNQKNPLTAEKILNYWSGQEISKVLSEYGEERFAQEISAEILEQRKVKPVSNTLQLVEILRKAIPFKQQHQKIHFATRTFQALRIAVNDEIENLKKVLPQALEILKPGGRLAVISFHSLEDRIVKNFFKEKSASGELKILTKKPVLASQQEIKNNPRSRSAKLRAAQKI